MTVRQEKILTEKFIRPMVRKLLKENISPELEEKLDLMVGRKITRVIRPQSGKIIAIQFDDGSIFTVNNIKPENIAYNTKDDVR